MMQEMVISRQETGALGDSPHRVDETHKDLHAPLDVRKSVGGYQRRIVSYDELARVVQLPVK